MAWKLVMMPHTVPNRPTNGAMEPTVARNSRRRSSCSISRLMVTSITFSTRIWMPPMRADVALHRALPLAHGGNEQRRHGEGAPVRQAGVELVQRLARPEHLLEAVGLAPRAAEREQLLDDDGPGPDRGQQQSDHDELDDRMRREKQLQEGKAAGRGGRQLFKHRSMSVSLPACRAVGPLNREAAQKSRPPSLATDASARCQLRTRFRPSGPGPYCRVMWLDLGFLWKRRAALEPSKRSAAARCPVLRTPAAPSASA